jgi:mycothiol synthase
LSHIFVDGRPAHGSVRVHHRRLRSYVDRVHRIELRPVGPVDLDTCHSLLRKAQVADGIPIVTPREEFDEWLTDPHFDPAADARLALLDGGPVGYGHVWHYPSSERFERVYLIGAVDPAHRRKGIGTALLSWMIRRGTERLAAAPSGLPGFLRTREYEWVKPTIALYRRFGFVPVRYFDEMLRPLEELPAVDTEDSIELVAWSPDFSEDARMLRNRAFADHWGSTPVDRDGWEFNLTRHGFRPDLSLMALRGGELAGICLNSVYPDDEQLTGRKEGWIDLLAVEARHRRQKIASALIARSLRAFKAEGLTHAMLGVDSDNLTGAHALYRRLGFLPLHRMIDFELPRGST